MIENLNKLLEKNDIMVRIDSTWYCLDEVDKSGTIWVSDEDGGEHEFDVMDVDEFDPMFKTFKEMDKNIVGIA